MIQPISTTNNKHYYLKNTNFRGLKSNIGNIGQKVMENNGAFEIPQKVVNNLRENALINNGIKIHITKGITNFTEQKGTILEHILQNGEKVEIAIPDLEVAEKVKLTENTTLTPITSELAQSFGKKLEVNNDLSLIHFTYDGTPYRIELNPGEMKEGIVDANNIVISKYPKQKISENVDKIIGVNGDLKIGDKYTHFTQDGLAFSFDLNNSSSDITEISQETLENFRDNLPKIFEKFAELLGG